MESVKRFLDPLLSVPAADPDEARRRKLLNILLFSAVVLMLIGVVATSAGLMPSPTEEILQFYLGVLAVVFGAALIFFINRFGLGRLARILFLAGLIAPGFFDHYGNAISQRGLLLSAIPIFTASFLLQPHASFVVAAFVVLIASGVTLQATNTLPDIWVLLVISLVALVSWLAARSLEHALKDLRTANRELDQRVA